MGFAAYRAQRESPAYGYSLGDANGNPDAHPHGYGFHYANAHIYGHQHGVPDPHTLTGAI